ncbi:hypothetical protein [Sulfurovum sp.]|uniref:hypothetical protein n=1 Tax=Sulfurovum sp. TaxID=1969726 RepID=UPI0035688CA4
MNIKAEWINEFEELLWEHHTCDWPAGNRNPDYPFQLAVAYFDWAGDGLPEETIEKAFSRYLEADNEL